MHETDTCYMIVQVDPISLRESLSSRNIWRMRSILFLLDFTCFSRTKPTQSVISLLIIARQMCNLTAAVTDTDCSRLTAWHTSMLTKRDKRTILVVIATYETQAHATMIGILFMCSVTVQWLCGLSNRYAVDKFECTKKYLHRRLVLNLPWFGRFHGGQSHCWLDMHSCTTICELRFSSCSRQDRPVYLDWTLSNDLMEALALLYRHQNVSRIVP